MDMGNYSRWINSYNFKLYEYNSIDKVYHNIQKNSRIIFILRHAERWPNDLKQGWLVGKWIKQAKSLWKKLSWWNFKNTYLDFYWSTEYKRTHQTSYYVWYGRWYLPFIKDKKIFWKNWEKYDKVVHPIDVVGPYYLWYDMGFKELDKKATHMADKLCELTKWHPFSFITSHDNLVIPLITWVSEWIIKFTRDTWVNYLSWIVIIVNDTTKKWEVYPIKTLKNTSMVI
jgi:hypothetical protein